MPTICSAMRKGDRTVGTSTNCSADCGSGIREREGHGEQEILGTSITYSAIGRSRIRKVSVTFSTGCGTGSIKNLHDGADVHHVLQARLNQVFPFCVAHKLCLHVVACC